MDSQLFAEQEEGRHDKRLKLLLMSATFFFIIAAYTVAKELKDSVFITIVGGKEYLPYAKFISIFLFIPLLMVYSKLVDNLKRYKLLMFYCLAYGLIGLLFSFFLVHPTIGLNNTNAGPDRLFGWLFYFFIEGYVPFLVSVFWSFVNSITSPEGAKEDYGFIVAGSKLGGMFSAVLAWLFLRETSITGSFPMSEAVKHQVLLGMTSILLLIAPVFIFLLMRKVSGKYLQGYEAVYKVEKKRKKQGVKTGFIDGLLLLVRVPYMFGIFCLGMCYELIYSVLAYQRIAIAQQGASTLTHVTSYLLLIAFFVHLVGFFISYFGTTWILKTFGEKTSLLLIPLSTALLFFNFLIFNGRWSFLIFLVLSRAIYFAFVYPVRESLYIPTVKALKFKTKSWIDAFGSKFSKANGQLFNKLTAGLSSAGFAVAQGVFFSVVLGIWFVIAWLLGGRFEKAIRHKEAIGFNEIEDE